MFKFILSMLIAYSPAFLSYFLKMDTKGWYAELVKPAFSPPAWVFGVVWTILYFLIGVSLYLFWKSEGTFNEKKLGYTFFAAQLLLNAAYTPVFFGLQSLLGGLIICVLLVLFIILTMLEFDRFSLAATSLLYPYIAWGLFATFLSYKIWALNHG